MHRCRMDTGFFLNTQGDNKCLVRAKICARVRTPTYHRFLLPAAAAFRRLKNISWETFRTHLWVRTNKNMREIKQRKFGVYGEVLIR